MRGRVVSPLKVTERKTERRRRQRERNVRPRAGFSRSENPLYRVSSLWLRLRPPLLQYLLCSSLHGPFSHGLPGLDYRFSTPPFPLLAPLDVLPFTTTSFPPLSSSPSCCLPCISTYQSPRPLSQGLLSRMALHTITFLLLG